MIFQTNSKITKNFKIASDYYKMSLDAPSIAKRARPGQFVNIRISEKYEPLLRRPFGVHKVQGKKIEILYEVVGKGTKLLSKKKPGEKLDILGPLGNGFSMLDRRHSILVAGGMGVAPLIFLAEKLAGNQSLVLIGAKKRSQVLCEEEFKKLGCDVKIATDDGSCGFKGLVTRLLKKNLSNRNRPSVIFACGPKPMLKEIIKISKKYRISAQVSLEEHMACGVGACFGCVVQTKKGYKRVCKDGPVFDAKELIF